MTSQLHLSLFLAFCVIVTSSVTSCDEWSWRPAEWLRESPSDVVDTRQSEPEDKGTLTEALQKLRSDFRLQISQLRRDLTEQFAGDLTTCRQGSRVQQINDKISYLALRVNNEKEYTSHVFKLIFENAKTVETTQVKK